MFWGRIKTFSSRQKTGLVLILIGIFFFGAVFSLRFYQRSQEKILSFSKAPKVQEEVLEDFFPKQIWIPRVKIDLSVSPAKAKEEIWEISENGASYLLGSGIPGRKGNVVIYGHNRKNLFGPIRWLKNGDEIIIKNGKGEEFAYKVRETKIVSPENIEVLAPTEEPVLTLYTCTGVFDSRRFVVVARLSS
jgi:sortase A